MSFYHYRSRDKFGKLQEGAMEADSPQAVAVKLEQVGFIPINITQVKNTASSNDIFNSKSVKFSEVNMFTRQLYTLQKAGVPLLSSLRVLKEQSAGTNLKEMIEQVAKSVEAGSNFSTSLARHPKAFNAIYVNMVKSGEASGKLEEVLKQLAVLREMEERNRLRIKAALRYPVMVVCAMGLAFITMIVFVVPRFAAVYGKSGTELPLPTKILIGIQYTVTHYWFLVILVGVGLWFLIRTMLRVPKIRYFYDQQLLGLPVLGDLTLKVNMARFTRVIGILINSGIPILQGMDLVAQVIDNSVLAKSIETIKVAVNEGKRISIPMKETNLFPPVVVHMVAVGEETGKLDELLLYVADYYDEQVDHIITNLVSLIEPLLILFLGIGVLILALGIFLPVWNLIHVFNKH